jgi:hypothetical protein
MRLPLPRCAQEEKSCAAFAPVLADVFVRSLPSPTAELPASARRAAAAEFGRLLRPGGRLFFVDSAQRGDGAKNGMPVANEVALDGFPAYNHEPFYEDYTKTPLAELFAEAGGLTCVTEEVAWVTKVMVFEKPAQAPGGNGDAAAAEAAVVGVEEGAVTLAAGDARTAGAEAALGEQLQ